MSRRKLAPRMTGIVSVLLHKRRCKVCAGNDPACSFCVGGFARLGCADCAELLPLCACFDRGGFRVRQALGGAS